MQNSLTNQAHLVGPQKLEELAKIIRSFCRFRKNLQASKQAKIKLPDFPWDALAPYGQKARAHSQGIIDLSQGTPVDPTPDFIQEELKSSSDSPSYPLTTGSTALREALKKYCVETLGASGDFDVLPTIGSKELVALLAYLLEAKSVLIPEIAYPTYKVGALLARAEVLEVGIDAGTWPKKADLAWINSPSNPTGRIHSKEELEACLTWARKSGATLASDECYLPFTNAPLQPAIFDRFESE